MGTKFIYIHIPKSAGTSHRYGLYNAFGSDTVFWYDVDSNASKFRSKEIRDYPIIGGHRALGFYPRWMNAIYFSVVRHPVERAVSLFKYRMEPASSDASPEWQKRKELELEYWVKQGMDPSSISRSIDNCDLFRSHISNDQCGHLSWKYATFSGVHRTMKKKKMIVGVFDKLEKFNAFFESELGLQIESKKRANISSSPSRATELDKKLQKKLEDLNREDIALYEFLSAEHQGLYSNLSKLEELRKLLAPHRL